MTVVAIVPAKDRADSVAATVGALRAVPGVDRVVVVDDGSTDATTEVARAAGAEVLRLPRNRGKGGAVKAAVDATPEADVYLLIDADLAGTAGAADLLLGPVLADEADLTIGVLPPADGRGGFGKVRDLAARGIARACGRRTRAPLSGQRAVQAGLLRSLSSAERFGLEVAMTIDAERAGARVVEVDVPMDHRHTGRSVAGFRHRATQGSDVIRALWPRLTSRPVRAALMAATLVAALALTYVSGQAAEPDSVALGSPVRTVVVFGIPHLGLDDLESGRVPNLDRIVREGALAAASVRTLRSRPSTVEAYSSLSAGTRVQGVEGADDAHPPDAALEGSTAREVVRRRTGQDPTGEVVVVGGAAAIRSPGTDASSPPGALADALHGAGLRTAVVNNADTRNGFGIPFFVRPAAVAAMDSTASVDFGTVDARLLVRDPSAPFGIRTSPSGFLLAVQRAVDRADFVVVDPGETDRAYAYAEDATAAQAEVLRTAALARTDRLLGQVEASLPAGALLVVVGITPPESDWALTPMVVHGARVPPGHLHSPSTQRPDLVTLTDLPATILDAFGVPIPDGMIGQPLRYRAGQVRVSDLERTNATATGRESLYYPMALTFIVVQALVYLITILALTVTGMPHRLDRALRVVVLTFAAWPVATFLFRIFPGLSTLGGLAHLMIWLIALAIALLAFRARGHVLAPLARIAALTVAVLILDVSTGAHLQLSSVLGYSPHTAARFSGMGNSAFAVLAATAIVWAAVHVDRAPRRREAVLGAGAVLALVVVVDGAPWLGSDVGGILSLVPVFGLTLAVMSGRRLSWRAVGLAALATVAVLAVAVGVDLLRPAEDQTHLARFVVSSSGDNSTFWSTVARKWSTNLRVFQQSIWTWMVPIIAIFMIYVLVIAKGWRRMLAPGSPLRAGVVGTIAAGVVGWLVNDSGIVVTALIFVFLGPYLTLLALAARAGEPELLAATAEPPVPRAVATGREVAAR